MKKILLISQIYPGSVNAGGNRVHLTVKNLLNEKFEITVLVLNFSFDKYSPRNDNEINLNIAKTFDLVRYISCIRSCIKKSDIIVCDGIISSLALILGAYFKIFKLKFLVVHHNTEFELKRKLISKIILSAAQFYVARFASINIFFSDRDANNISSNRRFSVCLPIRESEVAVYTRQNKNEDVLKCKENIYCAIPSNFNYYPNIDGLLLFYNEHRHFFGNIKIIISSPFLDHIPNKLRDFIDTHGDSIVAFKDYNKYITFLKEARCIILPVFRGSGIQLKAIDALFTNCIVYSSKMIINSHGAFSNFKDLDFIDDFVVSDDYSNRQNYSILSYKFIDQSIYDAIYSIIEA